ncbi:MAG TPA: hypothetical protein VNJ01_18035 [Bacteriovoracaceae bacterium]|nr:hypothetical protein [Bacteriovoracaceae bacterium]
MKNIIFFAIFFLLTHSAYSTCTHPQEAKEVATISNPALTENSGIDFSKIHPKTFWTLNDKNNSAEVFAVSTDGENLGSFEITGAKNSDWEDISVAACFDDRAKSCIYIADTGNNKGKREDFTIYVVEEPQRLTSGALALKMKINFTSREGLNFESVSVNERDNSFILVSKSGQMDDKSSPSQQVSKVFLLGPGSERLREIASIDFKKFSSRLKKEDTMVTSGDFHSGSQTLLLGTYGKAFEIPLGQLAAFATMAKLIDVPAMDKAESIAYHESTQGLSIFTSSEGMDQPLFEIRCR